MARALNVDIVRAAAATPELRAATVDGSLGTLVLRFSVFNRWYPVSSMWEGDFVERTMRGSFVQTIAEDRAGMRSLFDHGFDPQIGNKVLGPIADLREDPTTPVAEVPLFDTSYNRDLLPGLKASVYGSSFRFRVLEEAWNDEPGTSDYNPKGLPERTVKRVQLMEMGPVTFPANPEATAEMNSAGVRSLTDAFYDRLRQRDPQVYDAAVRAAGPIAAGRVMAVTRQMMPGGGEADPGMLAQAADAAMDAAMAAMPPMDGMDPAMQQACTLMMAAGIAMDALLMALGVTDAADAADDPAAPPAGRGRLTNLTGQPAARSGGGGDRTTGQPGSGQPTPSPQQRARHRRLRLEGILK